MSHSGKLGFVFQGKFHQGMAAVEVEFLADVLAMGFDRVVADEQMAGNLFARPAFGDQFEDAQFGWRQLFNMGGAG